MTVARLRRSGWQTAGLSAGLVLGVAGVVIVAHGVSTARWQHLYRQQTSADLDFVGVGIEIPVGGLLTVAATGLLLVLNCAARETGRFTNLTCV